MSELIHNLGIDWKLLLANATTFFIVLWLLKKFAYGPLMKVLEDRQKMAADTIHNSKRIEEELAAVKRQEQELIEQARTEALKIVQQAKTDADQARQRMMTQAEAEAAQLMDKTKASMAREKDAMLSAAKGELAEIVMAATNKVIAEQLDAGLQKKLTTKALQEIEQSHHAH